MIKQQRNAPRHLIFATVVLLSTALTLPTVTNAAGAELPKEGTFSATTYMHDTYNAVEMTPKLYSATWEDYGIGINDAGSGFFNKVAVHCVGSVTSTNAEGGLQSAGHCVMIDADGDRFMTQTANSRTRLGEPWQGEEVFINGTGKYAGIQGKYEYTIEPLRPFTDAPSAHGNILFVAHEKGSYKITGTGP